MNFEPWREKIPVRPTQFNSEALYSSISNLLNTTDDLEAKLGPIDLLVPPLSGLGDVDSDEANSSGQNPEAPERPSFSYTEDESNIENKLQFIDKEENIDEILRQPPIGLEWDVRYNDELPRQLSPDQYYK